MKNYKNTLMAATVVTALSTIFIVNGCSKTPDRSTPNDIATDLGQTGVMNYYRLDGTVLSRAKCLAGESTISLCQQNKESIDYNEFKLAFDSQNPDISADSRQRILSYLESQIAYRARSTVDLLLDDRAGIARIDKTFDFVKSIPVPNADLAVLFSPNGGVANSVIDNLSKATQHVDIAMYSFSDRRLQDKVEALALSGVKIRLILEGARSRQLLADRFELAGIDVRYVIQTMHHKFALIDNTSNGTGSPILVTGSANWSTKSDTDYDEDFIIAKGYSSTTKSFQAEFDHLWNHSIDLAGPAGAINRDPVAITNDPLHLFTSANFEAYLRGQNWAFRSMVEPEQGVAGKAIIEAINAATSSIKIATTHYRRKDIHEAVVKAMVERQVKVELVTDQQEFRSGPIPAVDDTNIYLDEKLAEVGAIVTYKTYMVKWDARTAKQMHSKYIIVDDTKVLSGSFNWSSNSETGSFENLSTWTDTTIVEAYVKNFSKVGKYNGDGGLDLLLQKAQASGGREPCAFTPISLSVSQFKQLRAAYLPSACR